MTVLLGLHGVKGAGKDTAFGFVREWATECGVRAARRGFADALKLSFARMFIPDCSLDEAVIWCDRLKFTGTLWIEDEQEEPDSGQITTLTHEISGRLAFQRYGTEGHRDVFGENFWVDALLPVTFDENGSLDESYAYNFKGAMDFSPDPPDICVVTDVRFENEAKRIVELGGHVLEIVRTDIEKEDGHSSEAGLPSDLIDDVIYNEGTPEDLRDNVRAWCDETYAKLFMEEIR